MERKLYRSANDKILGGVCGGIGEYFAIDPVIIRLLWVIFTLVGGAGLIAYIVASIIVPANPAGRAEDLSSGSGERDSAWDGRDRSKTSSLALGIILVAFGVFVLVKDFIPWMHRDVFLAVILVGLGIFFIIRKIR